MNLTVCCIVTDDTFYLEMMLRSVLNLADEVVIVDGSKNLKNKEMIDLLNESHGTNKIRHFVYPIEDLNFGVARKYAHDQSTGDWNFFLDADEMIHENDTKSIREMVDYAENNGVECLDVQYVHFYNDFSHIDNSEPVHIGLNRVYKNYKDVEFPARNHSLPVYPFKCKAFSPEIVIWHLGYLRGMEKIRDRFNRNFTFSEMHHPLQQCYWRDWHYFGDYPTKRINPEIIPQFVKDAFLMRKGGGRI